MPLIEYLQGLPWAIYATRALTILVVWVLVWILVRYLSRWITGLDEKLDSFDIDSREMKVWDRVLDYLAIIIGAIITFSVLGVSEVLYSALTAAGVIGIVIGFAVKDIAANFISGIFILLDQPFVSGDFVEIGSFSGTVSKISLRCTQIVTFEGPVVNIPNNKMATEPTINYTVAVMRLVEIKVSVPKGSDLDMSIQVLRDVAETESRRVPDKDITILVADIGEYAVDLLLRCFAPNDVWLQVRSDLRRRIVEEFQQQGLELAVPVQKTLYPDQAVEENVPAAALSSERA
jgi:small-conductance mechanosensitive channel